MTMDNGRLLSVLCCAGLHLLSPYCVPGTVLRAFITIAMANSLMALIEGLTVSAVPGIAPFAPHASVPRWVPPASP